MTKSNSHSKKNFPFNFLFTALAAIALFFISVSANAQAKCGFDEIYQNKMRTDPAFKARVDATNLQISQFIQKRPTPKKGAKIVNGSYVIPVVVHVLHTGGAEGTLYNPSTSQILGAINYLNQVYAGTHSSMFGGVGNMGLQFELAQRDPYCNPTNGINRVNASSIPNYSSKGINADNADGATEAAVKSFAKWNQTDYYNIWVVNKIDGADGTSGQYIAGYAYFPTNSTPTAEDGTVMLATTFITGNGTLPHEIGHAFALYHTFQGSANSSLCPLNNNCSTDGDRVCDTDPVRHYTNASGVLNQTCRTGTNPCTNTPYNISTEYNFMGYSDCNTLFTAGQKARVQAALSSPSRVGLTQSQAGNPCPSVTSATLAYSLRKLLSTYTGSAIQVRRSNDNASLNIGFVKGYLDTVALKAFVGSNNGFVTIWYDQSGNGYYATNTTSAQQPTIVSNGVITRLNGRVALYFGGSNLATAKATLFPAGTTMVGVAKGNSATPSTFVSKTGTSTGLNNNLPGPFDFTNTLYAFFTGNASTAVRKEAYLNTTNPRSDVSASVAASVYSFTIPTTVGANAYNYINGTLGATIPISAYADNGNSLMIGNRNDFTGSGNFWTTEIVLFNGVINDALRRSLEDEQKSYYINIPIITVQPSTSSPAAVCIGAAATTLSVTATGGGTLAYQWYKNAANSTEGGIPISGATSSTYTPATTLPGVGYYYVGVTSSVTNFTIYSGISGAFTVNPNQPTGTIGGTKTVCVNATTTLTAPPLPSDGTVVFSSSPTNKYRTHLFTTPGTSTFNTPVGFSGPVEVLIIGGGGSGGINGGGGGGAGGVLAGTLTLGSNTAYTVTVGSGGSGVGTTGGNSAFAGNTAIGGGGGGTRNFDIQLASAGGSGGGGAGANVAAAAVSGAGTAGQGFAGGNGTFPNVDLGCDGTGGGGGGATRAGTAGAALVPGNGGDGFASSITGTPLYYAAGGGGARTCFNTHFGIGGSGIGGNGGGLTTAPTSGAANTGSGGGGGGGALGSGSGGSGIVVVRYVDYSTGTWSSSNTNVATVNASGVVTGVSAGTATITLQNSVCSGASSTTVTVLAAPTVTFTGQPSGSICTGTDVTYSTQAFQSNYTWSIPGVLNTNYSITSGSTSSNTVTLKWLTAGSRTVSVNYSNAIGCRAANAATSNALTVTTANTITLSSAVGTNAQTKNINTAITNITYNTVGATGATVNGLPTGVTGSWASNVVTISGTPTAVGNYNYTVTLTGGCGTITQTGSITVIFVAPTVISPSITYTTPQAYTIGTAITPLAPNNTGGAVPASIFGQVTTFAGSGTDGAVDATGAAASFSYPFGVATDAVGNIYVADQYNSKIRKLTTSGVVTTLTTNVDYPTGVAVDISGNVYVTEPNNNRIRKMTTAGVVTTLAGSFTAGAIDATGVGASFNYPSALAVDAAGNVYVADQDNHKIRKITAAGLVSTLAGSGIAGAVNATSVAASFNTPSGIAVDAVGNIYVADQLNHKIRKITATGVVTTFAGSGTASTTDGAGTSASFYYPFGVTVDAVGNVYVAEHYSNTIRKITSTGIVTTLAGTLYTPGAIDAIGTSASFNNPTGVAVDAMGNAYISDRFNHKIRKINIAGYTISPALPTGLSFNPTTGIISGTPTVVTPATNYTIVAYNAGGSSTNTVSIATISANNANLSALTTTAGTLTPVFAAATTSYAANVTNTTTSVTVTPTKADANAIIQVRINTGSFATVASGTASSALGLNVGSNTIDVKVTAQDGTTVKTYTITVTRANAPSTLDVLGLGAGSPSETAYSLRKLSSAYIGAAIQVRRSSDNATQNIGFVNGNLDTATLKTFIGANSGFVSIWYDQSGYGRNAVQATNANQPRIINAGVVERANGIPRIYFGGGIAVNLSVPATSISVTSGTSRYIGGVGKIDTYKNFGVLFSNLTANNFGLHSSFDFSNPNNQPYFYNGLGGTFFSPSFTSTNQFLFGLYNTTLKLNAGTSTATVTTATNLAGLMLGNGPGEQNLNGSLSEFMFINSSLAGSDVVALEANQTAYYMSGDATLSALTTTAGTLTPSFAPATTAYTASVSNATATITVTPTITNANATVRINGTIVTSGSASGPIALNIGNNTITALVTAQDGTTIKGYTITVTRLSNNANLSALTTTAGTLTPVFVAATTAYVANVTNTTTSVTVTPTKADATSTLQIRVNGESFATVASGIASSSLLLNVGSNTIDIKVTAQDGTTVNTYTITVTRACANTASSTTISNCGSYTWNGTMYTASGTYTKTLVNAAGCDSVATLNLTIKLPTTSTTTISNCTSYTWNGTTYTASGTYTKTLLNAAGCDSVATLNLTINLPTTPSFTAQPSGSVCANTDVTYATQSGQSNYVWTIPGVLNTNYSITSGGTTSSNSVTLKWLTAGSKTISVNYTNSNGCTAASATSSNAITVSATSTIALSSATGTDAQSKTANTAIANITYNTVGATGATVTGLPTGVTGVWASNMLTISGTPSVAGFYSYTVTLTGGCGIVTATGSITVNAVVPAIIVPSIAYSTPQTYRIGIAIAPLTPTNTGGAVPATIYGQVTTFAGSGTASAVDATGTAASFNNPSSVATDAAGNIYVADLSNQKIRKITSAGVVTTFAGNGTADIVNATTASAASFYYPQGVTVDATGNVYVAEPQTQTIRKITAAGVVTSFAGGAYLSGTNDATGTAARFNNPTGLATDAAGNVYVADAGNNKIRKITAAGIVTTFAGSGTAGAIDATGAAATFNNPNGVAVDAAGNVYVSDQGSKKIRKITAAGVVTTLAGSGIDGSSDGTGASASFYYPSGLAVDAAGNVYVVDAGTDAIRKITSAGVVTTLAGGLGIYASIDAIGTAASFKSPTGIAVDASGNAYVAERAGHKIRKISVTGYTISPALPAGLSFNSATGIISGTPTVAISATNYTIVAYNAGGSNSSTVNIAIANSNNANLSALTTTAGTLTPAFAATTTAYTANVSNTTTSVTVTPTKADATSTLQVRINNGNFVTVASGIASAALLLNVGSNTIDIKVTAQDGTTVNTYTITVTRACANTTSTTTVSNCVSYTWNGVTYTASGTYTKTLVNAAGCDSVATLNLTITPSITPLVTIAANPGNSITTGTSVTFTATPTNGGTTPVYQWKKNGNNVGTNSITYTDVALQNGDIITCVLTSNAPCASPTTATSTSITMAVSNPCASGTTWISRTAAANYSWRSVIYGNGIFVAVATDFTGNSVMTSPDGITWTSRTTAANYAWWSVTYGNGVFVGLVGTGQGRSVMTSLDGITWTERTAAANNSWRSVTYGNGVFVAVSEDGTGNRVMTSSDGITWTIRTSAANNSWVSVTYGNGVFVAVAVNGSGNNVMTSPDGITWTSRTPAANNAWYSVTYGNGVFVAVANNGSVNRVMTSPDGITWSSRTPAATNAWFSVTYGNGVFIAVSVDGIGNRVMSSPDGINWISRTSAADNPWTSVTYANGVFVAVGYSGTGNGVMTSSGLVTPSVTIAANPSNSITTGTAVTFTATPTNGGTTPAYQWKKNGNNVGTNSVTYTDAALQNGDIITCVLTSNNPCASQATATSTGITINIINSSNANLSALTTTAGALTPVFTVATTAYAANVSNTTTSVTVTPTKADATSTLQVRINNGSFATVASGIASAALNLNVGSNTIDIKVTAQDGTTVKTYTITVTRACANTTSTTTVSNCVSYTWNGVTYTASGTYTKTLVNAAGCDSVATLNLTIKQPTTSTTTISNCSSYTWNGVTYTASGTYTKTLVNAAGCDSVATLNLTIKLPTTSTTTVSNCTSYTWNGVTYTTSSTYTRTLTNAAGCDSVATLNLTIKLPTTSTTTISNCTSYTWNGTTYTTSGTYTRTLTNAAGCDSVATLNLTIKLPTTSTTTVSNCISYTWNGVTYTASGNYIKTLVNAAGCDSVATLNLTIKQATTSTTTISNCTSYTWNGTTYTTSGTYTKTLVNAAGCDSIATLNLTIKQPTTSTTTISNCTSYTWNGTTYTASGTYTKTLVNAAGCDSIATLNLTIKQPTTSSTTISNCTSYTWNGVTYTASGTYTKTLVNAVGCDSVATLNLTIKAKSASTTNASICAGGSYSFNGIVYTTAGTYTKTLVNAAGCDSIATLNLTIKLPTTSTTTISNCSSYTWNGVTYSTSGIYTKTLVNAAGCDSVATLNLTIKQATTSTTTISNCTSYTWNGVTYTASGTYTKTLVNAAGCDSVATLNLTIKQATTSTTTVSNCNSYTWNSTTYTASGTYTKTLVNAAGCDSVATLNLTIKQPTTSTTTVSNCVSYTWNGTTYTTSGTYTRTLTNAAGCDSMATLNLTIKLPTTSSTTISNCTSYTWNGVTYSTSGIYTKTLVNAAGCDSIAILNLTIKLPTTSTTTVSNCNSYTWNSTTYTASGTYTKTLVNAAGCDSVATLNLTIVTNQTPSVSITASSTSVTANTSVTFTAVPILGGTAPSYTFKINGTTMQTGSSNTFTTSNLVNGATVSCTMLSNATCLIASTANSNSISVSVSGIVILPLSGGTQNASAKIIPSITMRIRGDVTDSVTTDANGRYSYNFQALKNYTITPYKNNDVVKASGINVLDVLQTQSHILNNVLLNTPYRIIAADVNSDAKVNVIDVLLIKRLILGSDTTFSGNKLWAFVDSSQVFANPANPFPFSNSRAFNNLSLPFTNQSFTGIKLGDVNQNWSPVVGVNDITPVKSVQLYYDTINTSDNSMLRLRVRVKGFKNVMGMQFALGFNAANLQLVGIENMGLAFDYNVLPASKGAVSFIWADANNLTNSLTDGTALFDVVLKKQSGVTNDTLSIHPNYTPAIAYGKNDEPISVVMASKVIGNGVVTVIDNTVYVEQVLVAPNPSKGLIQLRVTARKSQQISINITDVLGRTILKKQIDVAVGANDMPLNLEVNGTIPSGIYYLKVQGLDKIFVKQILVQK